MTVLSKLWDFYEKIVNLFINILLSLLKKDVNEETRSKIISFATFCLVGVLNLIISLIVYYIAIYINKNMYILGNTLGFFAGVLNSYFWNSNFVFKKTTSARKTLVKTFISYGVTLVLGNVLLSVMINQFGISVFVAPIINVFFTNPINYILNKYWAYRE